MKLQNLITTMLILIAGAGIGLKAQNVVTVGAQVTSESSIVSGKAYLVYYSGNGWSGYMKDTGSAYTGKEDEVPTENAVYYFINDGEGTWKVQNFYTGKYWGTPTANQNTYIGSDTGGSWALNFQSNGNIAPSCNGHSWNRSGNNIHPWSLGTDSQNQLRIYEVASFGDFTGKDVVVSATEAATITTGTWYVMSQRSRTSYVLEDVTAHKLKHTMTKPAGSAVEKSNYLLRLLDGDNGKYYIQTAVGDFVGQITQSTNVPTTTAREYQHTVAKINNTDGHYYVQCEDGGVVLDANDFTHGDPATVVGWGTTPPTATGSNNDWAFYPVDFVLSWIPTVSEVYTINNTNTSRGAMMYNGSSDYVWSSGKSGTFDASNANCQWVFCPTATEGQYYLYNVGAGRFAIPSATSSTASWVFSPNAVAVTLLQQGDGTFKIKTVTTDTYAAVSNGYNGPIINYNDIGGNFTITKVDGDASAAVTAAVSKLADNVTPLAAMPEADTDGWYMIRIKAHGTYADKYVHPAQSEINYNGTYYPMTFEHGANVRPSTEDVTYYTRISREGNSIYWQMPNGKYLYSTNSKFPVSTYQKQACTVEYSGNGFRFSGSSRYAVPYLLGGVYFIGETSSTGNAYYDVYPVDLTTVGLVAWQMICDNAPDGQTISCTRSDVKGLTTVYKNGFIFLPAGVTPTSADFTLDGSINSEVDADAHTVTFNYDPNLAMVEGSVSVLQGWQTASRDGEVMLLRVNVNPFKASTNVTMTVNLKEGAENNVSALTLYEASSSSPEIYSIGSGAPTKTVVATTNVTGAAASFSIDNLAAGQHYYWIGATVKSDATLGAVVDAAVTGITYTCNENVTNLDLTAVGDPADRGAMIFNVHSYPFLPRDNGSRVYRIPAMTVANDGSIIVACDKRYESHTDIGGGHIIDIVVRRSTDGGRTWSEPVVIAKGEGIVGGDGSRCGYGDPSLVKDNDGRIYCFFGAGNIGYFYGLNRICMSVSDDNGVTWSTSAANPPADLVSTGKLTDHAAYYGNNTCYGLFDYFVTSGRGLCTSEGYLMCLLPAQVYTNEAKTEHSGNSQDYIFYSTDKGATWHFSEQAIFTGGDEAKVIQANDGSLIASVRQGGNRGFNTATYTKNDDGTLTFTMGTQWNNSQLNAGGYANNQDILYYQRETDEGKQDVIIHSMTTNQHANFKLYYSTDKGHNWTEFLTVQTKGTRYVTMEKNPTDGSLYLFFEDQSLNSAGGYTDYNHYPLNFVEITREQLEQLIPNLDDYQKPDYLETSDVKIVYGTTGYNTYGNYSGGWTSSWTSNATSGMAGLKMSAATAIFNSYSSWNGYYNLCIRPTAANTDYTITLTAPEGYVIAGYSMMSRLGSTTLGQYATVTAADGSSFKPATNSFTPFTVSDINEHETSFVVTSTQAGKDVNIVNFVVTLAKPLTLNVAGEKSYATLYLPFDVTLAGDVQANTVELTKSGDDYVAVYTAIGQNVAAMTPVLLTSESGQPSTILKITSGLTPTSQTNHLVGAPVSMQSKGDMLVLNSVDDVVGFYSLAEGNTINANTAYLPLELVSEAKSVVIMSAEDFVTGIKMIGGNQMTNGNAVYNLQGQRIATDGKTLPRGVYIIGGRKVIVK